MGDEEQPAASGRLRVGLWVLLGFAVILGLGFLGEVDPLRSTSETIVIGGEGQTAQAEAVVVDMFAPGGDNATALVVSSAEHVASATNGGRTTDLYVYNSIWDEGDRGAMRCTMSMSMSEDGGGGGGAGCPVDGQSNTSVGGGMGGGGGIVGQPRGDWHHRMTVAWAESDAVWAITETASGERIKSNVVEGYSIALWDGPSSDQARLVMLFDDDGNELWRKDFDVISLPDIDGAGRAVEEAIEAVLEE